MADTPSFSSLRTRHSDFLRRLGAEPITPALVTDAQKFVESIRLAGRTIEDEDDREYLRSLLTFWGNWLYNQTRIYPDTNLEPFIGEKTKPVSALPTASGGTTGKDKADGQGGGGGRITTFTCLGLVGLSLLMLIVIGLLTPILGLSMSASATGEPGLVETLEVIDATLKAPTPTTATSGDEPTSTPTPTIVIEPTSVSGGEPTPTLEPGLGGGGFLQPISVISVQLFEPLMGTTVKQGSEVNIGVAFSNMQHGWEMFYTITNYSSDRFEMVVLPGSQPTTFENPSGVWVQPVNAPPVGDYGVNLFVATTQESANVLTKYARAGEVLPSDLENMEGIIRFLGLTTFSVR